MEKVALVTGSSSGIGLETVLALARDGYLTFASMRDIKKSAELEYAAKKENLKIKIIQLDVDKEESIVSAIKEILLLFILFFILLLKLINDLFSLIFSDKDSNDIDFFNTLIRSIFFLIIFSSTFSDILYFF